MNGDNNVKDNEEKELEDVNLNELTKDKLTEEPVVSTLDDVEKHHEQDTKLLGRDNAPRSIQICGRFQNFFLFLVVVACIMSLGIYIALGGLSGSVMKHRCQGIEFLIPSGFQVSLIICFVIYATLFALSRLIRTSLPPDEENLENVGDEDENEKKRKKRIALIVTFWIFTILQVVLGLLVILLAVLQLVTLITTSSILVSFQRIQRNGEITISALNAPVRIERDTENIIHIFASNDHDLYFAQGFATAQERLFQLEFQRRLGRGSLSEIVGNAAVSIDKFSRTIGFHRIANRSWNSLTNEVQDGLKAYVDGMNAFLATNPARPPEMLLFGSYIEKFEPVDAVTWAMLMGWDQSGNRRDEYVRYEAMQRGSTFERSLQLYPTIGDDDATILKLEDMGLNVTMEEIQTLKQKFTNNTGIFIPDRLTEAIKAETITTQTKEFEAMKDKWDIQIEELKSSLLWNKKEYSTEHSNNWVISGNHTKSGKPMTANDPHMGLVSPNYFLFMHLHAPAINSIGASLVGVPGITVGRNDYISWGITNAVYDVQDFFVLTETNSGQSYVHNGVEKNYEIIKETIKVKGSNDIILEVKQSIYGPIINEALEFKGSHPLALSWSPFFSNDTTVNAFFNVSRQKDWEGFKNSLKNIVVPIMSFIYGDINNNIGFINPGLAPIRADGHSGVAPVKGDGTYDYQGFIPFEELPQVLNPKEGYIITANNRVLPPGYKYNIQNEGRRYRAPRIIELMEDIVQKNPGQVTRKMMRDIQLDLKSPWIGLLRNTLQQMQGLSGIYEDWRKKLLDWDGMMSMESQEAIILEQWLLLLRNLPYLNKEISTEFEGSTRYVENIFSLGHADKACSDQGVTCHQFATNTFREAIDRLMSRYGWIPAWGSVHRAEFRHSLLGTVIGCVANVVVHCPGGTDTVNVTPVDKDFITTFGAAYRHVIELTSYNHTSEATSSDDVSTDIIVNTPGINGNFFDELYGNLAPLWAEGKYLKLQAEGYEKKTSMLLKP